VSEAQNGKSLYDRRAMSSAHGRIVALEEGAVVLHGEAGIEWVAADPGDARVGDLVWVEDGHVRVAVRGFGEDPGAWQRRTLDPRRVRGMGVRERVEDGVRAFFRARGFREVRTPALVESPGMEPHIRPFQVAGGAGWLHTSPEFAMKRLLVGGLERIWQMAPVFRDEPDAPAHRREFTMLEWYRAWAGEDEILADTEELVAALAQEVHGRPKIGAVDVTPPWPRLRVRDLFAEHAGVDLDEDLQEACVRIGLPVALDDDWDDLYFRIWLSKVEPALPRDRAVFVVRYPPSQAALAVVRGGEALRFEAYAAGLELGNGFEELTDAAEQRRRFEYDMAVRAARYPNGPQPPLPEEFLAALDAGMPPSGGIAVGVDRLAMLLAEEADIEYVRWL
jgi:elongation factor P--(R)-beta-lysine ligase